MAMTNAQKQAKHRLAVKERMARYEAALRAIAACDESRGYFMRVTASKALETPTTAPKTP